MLWPGIVKAATGNSIDPGITRIFGSDRYETAAKIAQAGWTGTSDYAIIAGGMDSNLIDALTASPLAAKLDAPILLTGGDSLNNYAQQELTRLAVKTVYIVISTGQGVNVQNIVNQVKTLPTVTDVQILGGSDPSQTSVNIAKEMEKLGIKINKAIVVGGNGVDALSISPVAGAQGIPILYTNGNTLSAPVSEYLNSNKSNINQTYVIGGTATISDTTAFQLPGSVERIAGQDRYDTNIQVLKNFANIMKYTYTFLANGDTLVDALAVSPLAARSCSPILLTSKSLPAASASFAQAGLSPKVIALGGESVVSPGDLNELLTGQVVNQPGAVSGSTDSANPTKINAPLKITGSAVTVGNSVSNLSIYIQGDNATLNNVSTQGTIFIDPGTTGSAHLQNVTAGTIIILTGGAGIDLQNVTSKVMIIAGSSAVTVKASGATNITRTVSTSSATIDDSQGGSFGPVTILSASRSDPSPTVQFSGTFTQPINVNATATITASQGASITNVVAAPDNSGETIALQGVFANLTVNNPSYISLGNNTSVQTLVTNAKANITVPTSSSITNLNTNNQQVTIGGVPSIASVTAINGTLNGTINVTFSNIDPAWQGSSPSLSMFTVTQSINGGAPVPVTVSGIGGNDVNYYLLVPAVSGDQSVTYYVSYKGGPPVPASVSQAGAGSGGTSTGSTSTGRGSAGNSSIAFTSPSNLPQAVSGNPYSYTFTATGGSGSGYTYNLSYPEGAPLNYPDGLSLSATGVLSGSPQAAGTWNNIPVTVTDSTGNTVTNLFNLTVTNSGGSNLTLTGSKNLPQAVVGQLYSYTFTAAGGSGSGYTYKLSYPEGATNNSPDGLNLSSTGVLSGYPQAAGSWNSIPVTVTDGAGYIFTDYFNLTVTNSSNSNLHISSPVSLPQGVFGLSYNYILTATGGSGSGYAYRLPSGSQSSFPAGLSLSPNGVISGTPQEVGTWSNIPVMVTDSAGNSVTNSLNLVIANPTSTKLTFTSSTNLPQGIVGKFYSHSLTAAGGSGNGYTYKIIYPDGAASNYPDGLSLSSDGVLSGFPQTPGTWNNIMITVTDSAGSNVTGNFTLPVTDSNCPNLTFTSPLNLPRGIVGQFYNYTITATGGSGYGYTYKLSLSGGTSNYLNGLTLSPGGVINGAPQVEGNWSNIAITVTDSYGNTVTNYFNLSVSR